MTDLGLITDITFAVMLLFKDAMFAALSKSIKLKISQIISVKSLGEQSVSHSFQDSDM